MLMAGRKGGRYATSPFSVAGNVSFRGTTLKMPPEHPHLKKIFTNIHAKVLPLTIRLLDAGYIASLEFQLYSFCLQLLRPLEKLKSALRHLHSHECLWVPPLIGFAIRRFEYCKNAMNPDTDGFAIIVRFLDLIKPFTPFLPEVASPESKVPFNQKLMWTGVSSYECRPTALNNIPRDNGLMETLGS